MAEQINDEELAKETIAGAPDITFNASETIQNKEISASQAVTFEDEGYTPDQTERDARLLANGLTALVKGFTNKALNNDQISAFEEITGELLKTLSEFRIPKIIRLSILGVALSLPFIPPLFRLLKGNKHGSYNADTFGA